MMKFINRLFAISFMLTLLFSYVNVAAIEENGVQYDEAAKVLDVLNIIKQNEKELDDVVTRGEFASYLARLMNMSEIVESEKTPFVDVKVDNPYFNDIYLMSKMGYINGTENGFFRPDDSVKGVDGIKMLVSLLGYNVYAKNKGGYPNGYINVAIDIKLQDGVKNLNNNPLTKRDVVLLFYNSLNVNVLDQVSFGENQKYETVKKNTVLSKYHNIYYSKGLMNSSSNTSLLDKQKLKKNQVKIDDIIYESELDISDLLGYTVEFYYKDTSEYDVKTILYINPIKNKNGTLAIKSKDLCSFENNKYTYFVGDMKKTALLNQQFDCIYNGVVLSIFDKTDFIPKNGNVTLVDNNSDGYYDVVFIKEYKTYVVDFINQKEQVIYDMYESGKYLKLDDTVENIILKNASGEKLELTMIQQWNVLNVLISKDGENVEITVANEVIFGTVTEKSVSKDPYITIDGEQYEIAPNYTNQLSKLTIGTEGYFYLDLSGNVAAVRYENGELYRYGFLVDIGLTGEKISQSVSFKLFDQSSKMVILEGGSKIKIDNVMYKDADKIVNKFKSNDEVVPQMFRYMTTGDDKILSIDTEFFNSVGGENENSLYSRYSYVVPSVYKSAGRSFSGKVNIDDDTKVFLIPYDKGKTSADTSFKATTANYPRNDKYYEVQPYFLGKNDFIADAIIIYAKGGQQTISDDTGITLVDKKVNCINKDGIEVQKLYGYNNNKYKEVITESDGLLDELERGDVVRFEVNSDGEICEKPKIEFKYSTKTGDGLQQSAFDFVRGFRLVYGKVIDKNGDVICITTGDLKNPAEKELEFHIASTYQIYQYDSNKSVGGISTASVGEIIDYNTSPSDYSNVLIYTSSGEPNTIIIYK